MKPRIAIFLLVFIILARIWQGFALAESKPEVYRYYFSDIFQKVSPSIVCVGIATQVSIDGNHKIARGGSGIVIDKAGHVLTNKHLIEGAVFHFIYLAGRVDQEEGIPAKLIATDSSLDLAILKIEGAEKFREKLIPAVLGNSDNLRVGEIVAAIGNPYNLGISITGGIVSALNRQITQDNFFAPGVVGGLADYEFIQIDAAINPGNSGGAILNLKGEVVGVTTVLLFGAENIGFAIPINEAKEILSRLLRGEREGKGWIGVAVKEVKDLKSEILRVAVNKVVKESPADKAGVLKDDFILSFNGREVKNSRHFRRLIQDSSHDLLANLEILRKDEKYKIQVQITTQLDFKKNQSQNSGLLQKILAKISEILWRK